MKKQPHITKSADKGVTENFFLKTVQDLKGFMIENFASKSDLRGLKNDLEEFRVEVNDRFATKKDLKVFSDKTQSNFENVFSRLDTLETENSLGTLQTREIKVKVEEHEKRLKSLEHAKN